MNKRLKKPISEKPGKCATDWGKVADWYDELVGDLGSEYHREVIIPGVLRMLELKQGHGGGTGAEKPAPRKILDLACGQGVLCRKLATMGHVVVGIDAAAPLIGAAKKRAETDQQNIVYEVADATKLVDENGKLMSGLQAGAFDAVTLVLAVQNLSPLSPVWHACHAALKPGGALVIVMMHPCFRIPKQSSWLWQEDNDGAQVRLTRQYLSSATIAIKTHPGDTKDDSTTPHFHRPLQAYINTLANAGLPVDHLEEWASHKTTPPGPRKAALDRARKEIPLFMALRARKFGEKSG